MPTPSPSTVSLVLGILGIVAALVGHYLSRRGKQDEVKQQQVAQAFSEKTTAFEQQVKLTDQYKADNAELRQQVRDIRAEWEARWDRQMNRCRAITDSASATITRLMSSSSAGSQGDGQAMLDDLAEHRDEDHG